VPSVRAPSGHKLELAKPEPVPLATYRELYFGVNWAPAEVKHRNLRVWAPRDRP
jgi:hypothetical protein